MPICFEVPSNTTISVYNECSGRPSIEGASAAFDTWGGSRLLQSTPTTLLIEHTYSI